MAHAACTPTTGDNSLTAAIRVSAPAPACRSDAPTEQPLFFLNVDDDFRFTQFFAEVLVLATQLLVLIAEGTALGLGAALLWRQGMQDSSGSFLPPGHQVRGVQAPPPEQGANAT